MMSFAWNIVVAEDEEADVQLLQRAFQRAGVSFPIYYAHDGLEAIQQLAQIRSHSVLLLLDLHMPKVDGFEVLQWLKENRATRNVSVVVLSSSEDSEDIRRAGALGANAYIVKPSDPFELERAIGRLSDFWLNDSPEFEQCAVAA